MKYAPQIESLITNFKEDSWKSNPFEQAMAIATESPELLPSFIEAVITKLPKGGTYFDAALNFLPIDQFPRAIRLALDALSNSDTNDAAESVISYASLQCVEELHPHLKKIFDLGINETAYYFYWPWRRSGTAEIAWLREVVETSPSARSRSNAWRCMLETRLASSFDIALAIASRVKLNAGPELYLDGVGFEHTGQGYRQLHPDSVYHLQFRADYFEDEAQPFHLRKLNHPTWQLTGTPSSDMVFGGSILEAVDSAARCAVCGGGLHHIFTMNPVPSDVGVSGLTTLTIGTCLSCLGWEEPEHFYQHDAFGCPIQIAYNGQTKVPQFPSEPLKQTTVSLVRTPERWLWQDWALANSRQNLHRVGGAPCFIQDSEYTRCPVCQQVMTFLLQLDSFMPSEDGVEWMWGSGGICYVFWCDHCWVSGISMQFT